MLKALEVNKEDIQTVAFYTAVITFLLLGTYDQAYATVFDKLGQAILNILNNTFLRLVAIISVIVVGLRAQKGHMEWSSAIWVIVGIVIMFGAAGIVDFIRDNSATT